MSLSFSQSKSFCSLSFSYCSLHFTSTCFNPWLFLFSVSFLVCLFPLLPLSLFELKTELCSHLSHHWGAKETSFIDADSSLCLTFSDHLVFPSSHPQSLLSYFVLKPPVVQFPKTSGSYLTGDGSFSVSSVVGYMVEATGPCLTLTLWLIVSIWRRPWCATTVR